MRDNGGISAVHCDMTATRVWQRATSQEREAIEREYHYWRARGVTTQAEQLVSMRSWEGTARAFLADQFERMERRPWA